jgi:hypothetical protein
MLRFEDSNEAKAIIWQKIKKKMYFNELQVFGRMMARCML